MSIRRVLDIPASIINLRISVAEQYGADRVRILEKTGISSELISKPTNRIPVPQAVAVWQAIIDETGNHDIGLESGLRVKFPTLGVLGYVMMNSSSVEKALEKLCVFQRIVASVAFWEMSKDGGLITYSSHLQQPWEPLFRYTIDFMMTGVHGFIKDSTAKEIRPIEVGFNFPQPANVHRYEQIFAPATIKFEADRPFLTYKSDDLRASILGSNSEMFNHFESLLVDKVNAHDQVNQVSRSVRRIIQKRLTAEIPSVEIVARELMMSVRNLQNHLKKEGNSYRSLLNDVRKDTSIKQLKNRNFSISEVAFITGFSDISVFSRSFKKWTGFTPSQFQAQFG